MTIPHAAFVLLWQQSPTVLLFVGGFFGIASLFLATRIVRAWNHVGLQRQFYREAEFAARQIPVSRS